MELIERGEIPFVRLLIPLILGILAGYLTEPSSFVFLCFKGLLLLISAALFLMITAYRNWRLYRRKWLAGIVVFLLIFVAAYIRTIHSTFKQETRHFSNSRQEFLITTIRSEPRLSANAVRFEVAVTHAVRKGEVFTASGRLLVSIKVKGAGGSLLDYGTQILVPSAYNSIDPPRNPAEFDYRKYLSDRGIYHQLFIDECQVKVLQQDQGSSMMSYAIKWRRKLVNKFSEFMNDREAVAVASTLILGYRSDLSDEIKQAYSSTGTMHVLSVSGMHVGIIFFFLAFLFRWLDRSRPLRILKAVVIIILIFAYTLITGLSAAACRAALMISFLILGKALSRNHNPYNFLAVSAVILLIYNPLFLLDIGFQLSYMAVFGLIFLYPKLYGAFYARTWLSDKVWAYSALSISAQTATFPISMFYFHQFPLYFLISNLLIVLPVALIMYTGMFFILAPFDILARPAAWLLEQLIGFTNLLLFQIGGMPGSTVSGIWLQVWEYALVYALTALLVCLFVYKNNAKTLFRICLLLIFILVSGRCVKRIFLDRANQVILYNLRNSFALGLIRGREAYVITDLDEKDKTYLFSVKPYLEQQRVRDLHTLPYPSKLENTAVFIDGGFVQFRRRRFFILDKPVPKRTPPLNVHTLIIRNNSIADLESVAAVIKYDQIVFDSSNYDKNIEKWVLQARKLKQPYYVLKRNKSLIIDL